MRTKFIAAISVLVIAISCQSILADELYTLTIPGQGWSVAFAAPPLLEFQGQSNGKSFVYQAADRKAFNLSLFVEEPKNSQTGHEACFNYYWPKSKRNPMIDQATVKIEKMPKFVKVMYRIKAEESTALNANYYFAFHDRWIDLHVSLFPPAPDNEQKLAAFEKSIVYEITKDKTKSK